MKTFCKVWLIVMRLFSLFLFFCAVFQKVKVSRTVSFTKFQIRSLWLDKHLSNPLFDLTRQNLTARVRRAHA